MLRKRWNIRLSTEVRADYSQIPRGEAANFRDAIAVLYEGPQPTGIEIIVLDAGVFEYRLNGYRILFEVLDRDTIRVMGFERLTY